MEKFIVEIDRKEISSIIQKGIKDKIEKEMSDQSANIEKSIKEYFNRSFFDNKTNQFDSALDWTIENAFREALEQAMNEMNLKELIVKTAKEFLSKGDYIQKLAEAKVKSSLGL